MKHILETHDFGRSCIGCGLFVDNVPEEAAKPCDGRFWEKKIRAGEIKIAAATLELGDLKALHAKAKT